MPLVLPKQNQLETHPPGTHPALCYRIIDLGHQFSKFYQKSTHKILISWETSELMADGRPYTISKRYTYSSDKKANLRKELESWRGKSFTEEEFGTFDLGKLIGVPCLLGISSTIRDGDKRSDVTSVMGLPKAMPAPTPVNEPVYFSLDKWDQATFDKLSDGLKTTIQASPEYQELRGGATPEQHHSDDENHVPEMSDVPF